MKIRSWLVTALHALLMGFVANSYLLVCRYPGLLWIVLPLFLLTNVLAGTVCLPTKQRRVRICYHGGVLLCVFLATLVISVICHIVLAIRLMPAYEPLLWSAVWCFVAEALLFWNGILCIYLTSLQLGVKWRVIGALCGMLFPVNLIVLGLLLHRVMQEVAVEVKNEAVNAARREQQLCKTRYPILLVHGVFFRDNKRFNYWGRIPRQLEENGATVYYGEHQSALSVAESAAELTARIRAIVAETGCEKVNIIAHSKGGLDCRYAIAKLEAAPYIASLTTVNTPHRGCLFADYLLQKIPQSAQARVAEAYNKTLKKLGDSRPDFMTAVRDLTASACLKRNEELPDPVGIYCQSVGSRLNQASGGKFPLNFSYRLAMRFSGANDGLVSEDSFPWGEHYTLITVKGSRGVSHADMIDLTRENIPEFDVREFYVGLVHDLKQRGL